MKSTGWRPSKDFIKMIKVLLEEEGVIKKDYRYRFGNRPERSIEEWGYGNEKPPV